MAKKAAEAFNVMSLFLSAVSLGEGFRNSSQELLVNVVSSLSKIKIKNPEREHPDYVDAVDWVIKLNTSIIPLSRTEQVRNIMTAIGEEMINAPKSNRDNYLAILSKKNPKLVAKHINTLIASLYGNTVAFESLFKNIALYIDNESPSANADLMILDHDRDSLPTSSKQYEAAFITINLFLSFTALRKKFESFNRCDASGTKSAISKLLFKDKFKTDSTEKSTIYSMALPHPTIITADGETVTNPKKIVDGEIMIQLTNEQISQVSAHERNTVRGSVVKQDTN